MNTPASVEPVEPAPKKPSVLLFMGVSLALWLVSAIGGGSQEASPGRDARILGGFVGSFFWGWLAWFLWTRYRRTGIILFCSLVALTLLLAVAAPFIHRAHADESFASGCQSSCEAKGATTASQFFTANKTSVKAYCQCVCSAIAKDLSEKERDAMGAAEQGAPGAALPSAVRERVMKVASQCLHGG